MNRRIFRLFVFLSVMGCVTTSCTKEELTEKPSAVVSAQSVAYVVDGQQYYANPQTDEEWAAFFDRMLALAEEGRTVHFWRTEQQSQFVASKEVITFTTKDRKKANAWAAEMTAEGYTVSVTYDQQTGIYTCTAIG